MKSILFLLSMVPGLLFAQVKPKAKTKAKSKVVVKAKAVDGFIINGTVIGFADGTTVALLNGQTGTPESQTTVTAGKFQFKGKVAAPDFKIILFNNQQPYITLFLDNSVVKLSAAKETLPKAVVTGSKAQTAFDAFNTAIEPYKNLFGNNAPYDSLSFAKAMAVCANFAKTRPTSYVTPLALIRLMQIADDAVQTEPLYEALPSEIKTSYMGNYVAQLIADSKHNAAGGLLPDFTQADTAGVPVSLSSLRGKYVLVDFWASWCGPCRRDNPSVVAAFNKYKDRNFTILGVSLDKAKQAWVDAIKMDGLIWQHVSDLQGWGNAVAVQNQIQSIPQNFLIDPQGNIVARNLHGPALERKLAKLLQ